MGSFIDFLTFCVIDHENIFRLRSRCPACHHVLHFSDLIPILSYVLLGGRCRYCNAVIPVHHMINELICSLVFPLLYIHDGYTLFFFRDLLLLLTLYSLSLIDLYTMEIPDVFHFILILIHLKTSLLTGGQAGMMHSLAEGIVTSLYFYLTGILTSRIFRKETIGGGDVKLFFSVGLYLGISGSVICVFLACLAGLTACILSRKKQIPFGPCISFGFMNMILFGNQLKNFFFGIHV